MADTRRLLGALQTLLADNTSGDISPQDLRDGIISTYPDAENVMNHGAVGDGVADDQPAIQAALDALTAGDTLVFPQGTYLLSTAVAGEALTTKVNDVTIIAYGATIKLNIDAQFWAIDESGVSIFGGTWDANSAQTGNKNLFNIPGDRFHLENTTLLGSDGFHVRLRGSSQSIIRSNRITANVKSAIFSEARSGVSARDNLIDGNFIFQTGGTDADPIQIHSTIGGQDVSGVRIVNNKIETFGFFGIEVGPFSGGAITNVVIANNRITTTGAGTVQGGISVDKISDSQITGNVIDLTGTTVSISGIEIVGTNRTVVDGNFIKQDENGRSGITVGNDPGTTNDNVISNNVIDGFDNGTNANIAGIKITTSQAGDVKRNIVIGNTIRFPSVTNAGVVYSGIFIWPNNATADISDNVVSNNIIFGNGDTAIQGIRLHEDSGGTSTRNSIFNNVILDVSIGINRKSSVTNSIIRGNRFNGVTTEYGGTRGTGEILRTPNGGSDVVTLANDATPTVAGVALAKTGGTTTITDFDDGVVGQTFTLRSDHAVTITDGTNILLNGSANFVMAAGDTLTLSMINDQVWEEVARKTN